MICSLHWEEEKIVTEIDLYLSQFIRRPSTGQKTFFGHESCEKSFLV